MNKMIKLKAGTKFITLRQFGVPVLKHYSTCVDRPDDPEITIPVYKKDNETIENTKARLMYQSRKRGILENDLLLSTFANKYLKGMNEEQVKQYDLLINKPSNDWDIYYWATGKLPIPEEFNNEMMKLFLEHVKNVNKEKRIRQPDL